MKKYSIESVGEYIRVANALKINLGLVGAHGRAKTSYIKAAAERDGFELITLVLSRMSPEDMIGLPVTKKVNGETVTGFSSPDWLVRACDPTRKVMLFFDEINNAEVDTLASILDLVESREANGLTLADSTQIVCAFNPVSIAPNAKTLSKAIRDRFCLIPILDKDSVDSYRDYYKSSSKHALSKTLTQLGSTIIPSYDEEVVETANENAEPTWRSLEHSYDICNLVVDEDLDEAIAEAMVVGYVGGTGHVIFSALINNIRQERDGTSTADLYERVKSAYEDKGNDAVVEIINGLALDSYADCAGTMDVVRDIVDEPDLLEILHKTTTKEFISRYMCDIRGEWCDRD